MLPKHKEELRSILEEINPDQILVEIINKDLKRKNIRKYPKEMIFAYKWGIKHKKKASGFDASIKIEKKIAKKREKQIMKKLLQKLTLKNWKEYNKRKYDVDKEIWSLLYKLIDRKKHELRQREMLKNIHRMMVEKDGTILILTGVGHLNFFEKNLKGVIFPFRK